MPNLRSIRSAFAGGEITPELMGRVDLDKTQSALALCQNFVVLPHGPVQNRAGLRYINSVKNPGSAVRLIPFSFNNQQTFAIELGAGYFRFHALEATLKFTLSAEMLANNLFSSDLTHWTLGNNGSAQWNSPGHITLNSGWLYQALSGLTVGAVYSLAVNVLPGALMLVAVEKSLGLQDALNTVANQNIRAFNFTATAANMYVRFSVGTYGSSLAGVSVRPAGGDVSAYDSATGYAAGALVYDVAGNVYNCLKAVSGQNPPNAGYWNLLPQGGMYELANNYAAADLFDIHYVQSGDVLSFTHPAYPPMQLQRYGNLKWLFAPAVFQSPINAPLGVNASANYPHGGYALNASYLVTALDDYGLQESLPSASTSAVSNDLSIAGNYNSISWQAVSGAGYYNIYKADNGIFGFIGQVPASSLSFTDRNITADVTRSPPLSDTPFNGAGNYPAAVGYYEQRRVFGGSFNQPQNLWASQPGTESNLNYSVPSQAGDALRIRIAALRANFIRHIVPLLDLIVLTASTEWRIFTASGDALAPATVTIKAQSQNGASNVQPVVVDNACIYGASQGGHVRELAYQWAIQGYQSRDLCLLARHLFDGYRIVDLAFSRSPYPILWAVNDQGKLLGLTYLPEQQVLAWHQHVTAGRFESICVIQEGNDDVLYAVVQRDINGVSGRFVEVLDTRRFAGDAAQAFFVDCGCSFISANGQFSLSGSVLVCTVLKHGFSAGSSYQFRFSDAAYNGIYPVTVLDADHFSLSAAAGSATSGTLSLLVTQISGLNWLAGATVAVLADGKPLPQALVSAAGVLSLAVPAAVVQIGLPYSAVLQTPPLAIANDAALGQGRVKNINKVWARCTEFTGCHVGPALDKLVPVPAFAYAANGATPLLGQGEFRVNVHPQFNPDAAVVISQPEPLPLTVCELSLEVMVGS